MRPRALPEMARYRNQCDVAPTGGDRLKAGRTDAPTSSDRRARRPPMPRRRRPPHWCGGVDRLRRARPNRHGTGAHPEERSFAGSLRTADDRPAIAGLCVTTTITVRLRLIATSKSVTSDAEARSSGRSVHRTDERRFQSARGRSPRRRSPPDNSGWAMVQSIARAHARE